jgi:hypothetical protein
MFSTISSDIQCERYNIHLTIKSLTLKYRMSRWFVHFPDDNLPFFISSIVLWLSSQISEFKSYPCSVLKLFVPWMVIKASSTAINSVSVELLVFTFCLLDLKSTNQSPAINTAPLCPFISAWEAYDPSINQVRLSRLEQIRV